MKAWDAIPAWGRIAILVGVGAAGGYGFGRYAQPTLVKDTVEAKVEKHEEVKQETASTKVEAPVRVTTTTRTRPAPACPVPPGCPECPPVKEVVRVEERGPVVTTRGSESTRVTDTEEERREEHVVEHDAPRLMLAPTIAFRFENGIFSPPAYGALVGYRLVGPVWALGQGEVGAGSASFRLGVGVTLF